MEYSKTGGKALGGGSGSRRKDASDSPPTQKGKTSSAGLVGTSGAVGKSNGAELLQHQQSKSLSPSKTATGVASGQIINDDINRSLDDATSGMLPIISVDMHRVGAPQQQVSPRYERQLTPGAADQKVDERTGRIRPQQSPKPPSDSLD